MTTLKKGDLIKNKRGETLKVMEVLGQIFFISVSDNLNACWFHQTEEKLKRDGYTWDTPAWEPALNEKYWYIYIYGTPISACDRWENSDIDKECRDFLGIYETKELCEAALLEIPRKRGK